MSLVHAFLVPHPPLIIPGVGRGQEKKIQKTIDAYDEVGRRIAEIKPDTIIITTPHTIMYSDYIHISPGKHASGDFGDFGAPGERFEADYDTDFVNSLTALAEREGIEAGTMGEKKKALDHATMVPLHFVNKYYSGYKLVRISLSGLSPVTHYRFGKCIARIAAENGKKIVLIASGDLSHKLAEDGPYGFAAAGPVFDRQICEIVETGNFLRLLSFDEGFCDEAAECGLRSFIIMAGALDGKSVKSELLSYEGPFGVGYGVGAFTVTGKDEDRHFDEIYEKEEGERIQTLKSDEDAYVRLARKTLETYIKEHRKIRKPEGLEPGLSEERAGVFVSLKMHGKLRGCIGTTSPTTGSIAEEIIQNAISSGTEDPRFSPVEEYELPWLVYSVDVLGKSEPIVSLDELDVIRYGVIVSAGGRRGLLLPNLEGVNTPEEQVSIALRKAGISPEEHYEMERFEVVRHK